MARKIFFNTAGYSDYRHTDGCAKNAEFGGADGQAQVVTEINPDYKPWFNSIWEPPAVK